MIIISFLFDNKWLLSLNNYHMKFFFHGKLFSGISRIFLPENNQFATMLLWAKIDDVKQTTNKEFMLFP